MGYCLSRQETNTTKVGKRQEGVTLSTSWCWRRYFNHGENVLWMIFELVGYTDRLLEQLVLKTHLRGWFRDLI